MDSKILLRKNTKCYYDPKNGNLIPLILIQGYELDCPEFLYILVNGQEYIMTNKKSDIKQIERHNHIFKLPKGTIVREEFGLPIKLACDIDIILDNDIPFILTKGTKLQNYNGNLQLIVKKDSIALINNTYFTYFYHGNINLDDDAKYFVDNTFGQFLEIKDPNLMFLNGIKIDYESNKSLIDEFIEVDKHTFEIVFKYQ